MTRDDQHTDRKSLRNITGSIVGGPSKRDPPRLMNGEIQV